MELIIASSLDLAEGGNRRECRHGLPEADGRVSRRYRGEHRAEEPAACDVQDRGTPVVDPADARGRIVALTSAGRQLTDKLIRAHMANEADILGALDDSEQGQLAALLGKLLAAMEAGVSR